MEWGMPLQIAPLRVHPAGEVLKLCDPVAEAVLSPALPVDTHGRRFQDECPQPWNPNR